MSPPNKRVKVESPRLPCYDPRSPRYYELRAGYPEGDTDFYRNTQPDGSSKAVEFSQDRFVRDFNVTVGVFYEHWKVILDLMLKEKLYETDFNKDKNAEYRLWGIFEKIYTDARFEPVVNHEEKGKWAFDMFEEDGSWPLAKWSWGPACLTPHDYSDEVMQYQHLEFRACFIPQSAHAAQQVSVKKFAAHVLLHDIAIPDVRIAPVDVKVENFSFERLVNVLKHKDVRMLDDEEHDITNMHIFWERGGEEINIGNQQELAAAISRQRNDKKWMVDIFVEPRN